MFPLLLKELIFFIFIMKSPLAHHLFNKQFVEAKELIVQRLDMVVCRRRPRENYAAVVSERRFLSRGVHLGQLNCATLMCHYKTKLCLLHANSTSKISYIFKMTSFVNDWKEIKIYIYI